MPKSLDPFFATPGASAPGPAAPDDLSAFGWRADHARDLSADAFQSTPPVRVMAVHRTLLQVAGPGIDASVPPFATPGEDPADPADPACRATVGDWLLYDRAQGRAVALLPRRSLVKRRAPGTGREVQLIAANVDTIFVVTSCNQEFNIARLERYLALAHEAGVTPVVVLTKADLAGDAADYAARAAALMPGLAVETLDATAPDAAVRLAPWCGRGQTVAFLGSSGVGKSTLVNALMGRSAMATAGIREDDAKGRHTTSHRQLHRLPQGGWVLDTPGMRELQLTDSREGLEEVFNDIAEIAATCRFRDCSHQTEPGCAVQAALQAGEMDEARLARWMKLIAEDRFNSQSLAERRAGDKAFGKMVKRVVADKRKGR